MKYVPTRRTLTNAVTGDVKADDIPECRDRQRRLTWMAEQGVVVEALDAALTAFNRWLEEEWGFCSAASPIYGSPLLNLTDMDWAISELERVLARGAKLVHLRPGPVAGQRSPADPAHDPFWARCAEAGIPVDFHLGNSGDSAYYSALWGKTPNPPNHRFSPFQRACAARRTGPTAY